MADVSLEGDVRDLVDGYLSDAMEGFLLVATGMAHNPADPQLQRVMQATLFQLALLLHVRGHLGPNGASA